MSDPTVLLQSHLTLPTTCTSSTVQYSTTVVETVFAIDYSGVVYFEVIRRHVDRRNATTVLCVHVRRTTVYSIHHSSVICELLFVIRHVNK
jgi:hypothetical protein